VYLPMQAKRSGSLPVYPCPEKLTAKHLAPDHLRSGLLHTDCGSSTVQTGFWGPSVLQS